MVSPPRVSVVMPVHNGEAFLAEAVRSVLGQTLTDLELIAVDDGSHDGSRTILEAFARDDDRLRLIVNERNVGVSAARNRGWRAAKAPYVACLDADDVALPDRLATQEEYLEAHPSVAAVGGSQVTIDRVGRPLSVQRYPTSPQAIRSTLLRHNCLGHSTMTIRRSALDAVRGYRFAHVEDYDLWLRLSERFELTTLRETVALHRVHLGQQSARVLEADAMEARIVCAAARVRAASGIDPLDGVGELSREAVELVGVEERELEVAVERELIGRAAVLADAGSRDEARRLVDRASQLRGPRAEQAFLATVELRLAESAFRMRHTRAGAGHVLRAMRREPRHALSLARAWSTSRVPGGSRLWWT